VDGEARVTLLLQPLLPPQATKREEEGKEERGEKEDH